MHVLTCCNRVEAEVRPMSHWIMGNSKRICILVHSRLLTSIERHIDDSIYDPRRSHEQRLKKGKLEPFSCESIMMAQSPNPLASRFLLTRVIFVYLITDLRPVIPNGIPR